MSSKPDPPAHRDPDCPVGCQPSGQAKPEIWRTLPGDLPFAVRCLGRKYSGSDSRDNRGRLVRHPDLPGVSRSGGTTPWNLFSNPAVIHYTIDVLACAIGPLYGILLVDYYVIKKEQIVVKDLYTMSPNGRYWYQGGVNLKAVFALIPASFIGFTFTMLPPFNVAKDFSLFIGAGLGGLFYFALARHTALATTAVQTT
jgi:hypothetical protein